MNLHDIYQLEGFAGLKRLAEATEADPQYLRQCATGWRGKRPSPTLAQRLIDADSRLTWEAMYRPSVAPAPQEHAA